MRAVVPALVPLLYPTENGSVIHLQTSFIHYFWPEGSCMSRGRNAELDREGMTPFEQVGLGH